MHPQQAFRDMIAMMVTTGRLTVRIGDEPRFSVGMVPQDRPDLDVAVHIASQREAMLIAADPDLELGETYVSGALVIEQGSLWLLLELIGLNLGTRPDLVSGPTIRRSLGQLFMPSNTPERARRNAARGDLGRDFYSLFLDADLHESSGYFPRPGMTLEEAQAAKTLHIAAKLGLQDGQHVLDIGCGWGGLALCLAQAAEVEVLGITLPPEQQAHAQARAEAAGLSDRVRFELADYRALTGSFDRIVAIGMLEHVGADGIERFFQILDGLLTADGVALVHAIGRQEDSSGANPWVERHIAPGAYIPTASQALAAVERSGLWATDVEFLRQHDAETLRHWRERFEAQRETVLARHDEGFYRMWHFYLALGEMALRYGGLMAFELQIAANRDLLPITRDYLAGEEARLARRLSADARPGPVALTPDGA